MKPSWKDSPGWAVYMAMDESGHWSWHENKPVRLNHIWESDGKVAYANKEGQDWRRSLEERQDGSN